MSTQIELLHDTAPPPAVEWQPEASVPREEMRTLIEAFELGKVIQYESTPEGTDWMQWYYDDEGGHQPVLGQATYPSGAAIQWRIPEQEQHVVEYKTAVMVMPGQKPYVVVASDMRSLANTENGLSRWGGRLLVDKDEALIERKITCWVLKEWL